MLCCVVLCCVVLWWLCSVGWGVREYLYNTWALIFLPWLPYLLRSSFLRIEWGEGEGSCSFSPCRWGSHTQPNRTSAKSNEQLNSCQGDDVICGGAKKFRFLWKRISMYKALKTKCHTNPRLHLNQWEGSPNTHQRPERRFTPKEPSNMSSIYNQIW